jgi:hypothetical protein
LLWHGETATAQSTSLFRVSLAVQNVKQSD